MRCKLLQDAYINYHEHLLAAIITISKVGQMRRRLGEEGFARMTPAWDFGPNAP